MMLGELRITRENIGFANGVAGQFEEGVLYEV
jgi:hypothetical protein